MARYTAKFKKKRQPEPRERISTPASMHDPNVFAGTIGPWPKPAQQAAPAPASPARPALGFVPDAAYQQQIGLNERQRGETYARYGNPGLGADNWQQGLQAQGWNQQQMFKAQHGVEGERLAQQYGLQQGYDTDPFSLAKQMERSYQEAQTGTTNSAQGHLYSGSLGTERAYNENRYQQGRHDLQQNYETGLRGISDYATQALSALDQGDVDAYSAALERMVSSEPTPMAEQPSGSAADSPTQSMQGYAAKLAKDYMKSGYRSGTRWRWIIDQLGYDPRQGKKLVFR